MDKPKGDRVKAIVRNKVSEVLAGTGSTSNMNELTGTVAQLVNNELYKSNMHSKLTEAFVDGSGVLGMMVDDAKRVAAKETVNSHATSSRKSSRNNYKKKDIEEWFPVTRGDLLKGLTHERAKKVLQHLKKWEIDTCDKERGLTTTHPGSLSNKNRLGIKFGVRKIFQSCCLLEIDCKDGIFSPIYAPKRYSFRIKGSEQFHGENSKL